MSPRISLISSSGSPIDERNRSTFQSLSVKVGKIFSKKGPLPVLRVSLTYFVDFR